MLTYLEIKGHNVCNLQSARKRERKREKKRKEGRKRGKEREREGEKCVYYTYKKGKANMANINV